ncbi:MAG: DUF305 domain-containing protein [Niastella sp. SCN 39-18]|nr:DUF305 domain-containing protein [Sphingobacteriales bacterium]ODT51419.1 MAG: DUF305 domain-containing protein [Niastella sp. SCN 39-18]OJW08212.1 MAG: DUF305 domain-containing protein [Sphingobacteriales bacterium 39-19]
MSYRKFSFMIIISFVMMYCVMFLNITQLDYFYVSTNRLYMALLMICPMAVVMMVLMGKMYPNKKLNKGIIISAVIVFIIVLAGLRTQTPIGDVQYMKAMIPHHSSAILTSENANIKDPEVRKLADGIIETQKKEIAEMRALIQKLEK